MGRLSMHMTRVFLAVLLVASMASTTSAAGLTLSIQNGLVSLDAQDVTIRQILQEWARVGRTQVVNAERIVGGPVTLKFAGVPEKQALDIILRAVPGYVAARRETLVADASVYDRILIMPTTTAVAAVRPQQPQTSFPGFPGLQGGANVTQLRPGLATPAAVQGAAAEVPDPAADQVDDPAIATAAAAGLIAVPATSPVPAPVPTPMMPPTRVPAGGANTPPTVPGSTAPINPWNSPVSTPQPTLAPPAPTPTQPGARPQPPQADR